MDFNLQVEYFVSRDLDSHLGEREASAVTEWMRSGKSFHIMRDHEAHCVPINGGAWGVYIGEAERRMFVLAFKAAAKDPLYWAPPEAYGADQGLLKR